MKINVDNASDETVGWLLISKALRQKPVSHLFSNSFLKTFFSLIFNSLQLFLAFGADGRRQKSLSCSQIEQNWYFNSVDIMYTPSCIVTLERGDGLLFEYGKIQERLKGEN